MNFSFMSRDKKARAAKDHGKKFKSKLPASFSIIIHCNYTVHVNRTVPLVLRWRV